MRRNRCAEHVLDWNAYDCAFLEPLALPPDLPPPVMLIEFGVVKGWENLRLRRLTLACDLRVGLLGLGMEM